MIMDMTKGKPSAVLWKFSLPMLLSMAFQQIYSIADSVIAGQVVGVQALAAIGASYPITVLFLAFANGASMGCSVVVSHIFGSKHIREMKTAVYTAVISVSALSLFLTGVGTIGCNALMRLMKTPDDIFSDAVLYLRIYIFGLLFLFLYNTATAVFNALGDSRTPLYFLIFSSVLNIGLDLLFTAVIPMGIAGVAWATFIAQGIASMGAVVYLLITLKKFQSEEKGRLFDARQLLHMTGFALPSMMQQSFISVGQLCVQGLINSFGSVVVAGYSSAFKINTFAIMSITTLSNAVSSYSAQNYGAGKIKRIRSGTKSAWLMTEGLALGMIAVILCFSRPLLGMFVDNDAGRQVIEVGVGFLRIVTPFYIFVATKLVSDGILRGMGNMKVFVASTLTDLVLRVGGSFVFVIWWGYRGIWWSYPLGWIIGTLLSVGCFMAYMKKMLRK